MQTLTNLLKKKKTNKLNLENFYLELWQIDYLDIYYNSPVYYDREIKDVYV